MPFRQLNEEWIRKWFSLEPQDIRILEDPESSILSRGGQIYMAVDHDAPVGCCALIPAPGNEFELAKMAVAEPHRGRGIGRRLLDHAIAQARLLGAGALVLGSNASLTAAVRLYEAAGFRHLDPASAPSPYARANVRMRLDL